MKKGLTIVIVSLMVILGCKSNPGPTQHVERWLNWNRQAIGWYNQNQIIWSHSPVVTKGNGSDTLIFLQNFICYPTGQEEEKFVYWKDGKRYLVWNCIDNFFDNFTQAGALTYFPVPHCDVCSLYVNHYYGGGDTSGSVYIDLQIDHTWWE